MRAANHTIELMEYLGPDDRARRILRKERKRAIERTSSRASKKTSIFVVDSY